MPAASTDYLVRAARADDAGAYVALKAMAGAGFTSMSIPDEELGAQLAAGEASFTAAVAAPGKERYFLALVHRPTGAVVGAAQIKAAIGLQKPFFNFRILKVAQASHAAGRRFDIDMLALVNEFAGCAEIGSLFVDPAHRVGGVGRVLARARYMLMGAAPQRFGPRVIAELRGVVSADGQSPFYEHLCRPFFRMTFDEADKLSATSDNQFILDLAPKHPIYVDLLAPEARAVIGQTHPEGEGARKMLGQEGFRYDGVIDIFDGGPVMTAERDAIATRANARRTRVRAGAGEMPGLVAQPDVARFACAAALMTDAGDHVRVDANTLAALGLSDGDQALVCAP
jgi:arginine N-succinyltransferase